MSELREVLKVLWRLGEEVLLHQSLLQEHVVLQQLQLPILPPQQADSRLILQEYQLQVLEHLV